MALTQAQADAIAAQSAAPSNSGLGWADIPSSQFTAGLQGGAASWAGGMGALAGALGFDTEDFVRRKQAESAFYQRNAPGTTQFFGEDGVTGSGSLTDYMAYLTGMAIPYVGEFAVGAATGGLGLAGSAAKMASAKAIATQAARNLGGKEAASAAAERTALELAAKQVGQRYGASAGGVAASYPSAVGDILGNQLEAGVAFDDMQLAPALAGGVPYAALNLLGGEGAVLRAVTGATRGTGAKGVLKSTLAGENLPGAMVRGGVRAGLAEGAGETGQEMINQLAGQMAVNPNKEFLSPDALHRYAESFASGMFGPGGPMGAVSQVFAKPIDATPEAIATRTSQLDEALQNIQAGHQTWMDQKDQAKNDAEQTKKDIEEQLKQEEADFYAGVDQEEKAKKDAQDKTAQLGALAKVLEAMKPDAQETTDIRQMLGQDAAKRILGQATAASPEARLEQAQANLLAAGDNALLQAFAEMEIRDIQAEIAAQPVASLPNLASLVPPRPLLQRQYNLSGSLGEYPTLSPSEQLDAFNQRNRVTTATDVQGQLAEIVAEREYEGRMAAFNERQDAARAGQGKLDFNGPTAPANRAARRAGLQAIYERSKAIEAEAKRRGDVVAASNAALDVADAEKALQEEQAWQQSNADPRYGMVPDMFGRSPDFPSTPASPTAPNLANVNEFVTEGLRISEEYKQALASGDKAAIDRLGAEGQALYERMALGFPRDLADTSTPTLFQNREGDAGPSVTATGKAASGNAFKPKKEKTRGTQAPQAKQAEPAAQAEPEQKAEPATGAVTPSPFAAAFGVSEADAAKAKTDAEKEAADAAAQKTRLGALASKRKKPKVEPVVVEAAPVAETEPETNLLPELDAPWNVRKENRTRIEQLAAKGDEAKIAREWNEQYGDKFQFPELARDLQLLIKHALEAVEVNRTTKRTQSKMNLDLADRIEQEQAARNAAKTTTTTEETQNEPSTVEESPVPAQEEGQDAVPAQEEALPEVAPAAQDNDADAAEALANISALPGRTLSSKKAKVQVELETDGAFTDSMSPVNAVEFTNEKIRAYDAMRKACLGG